MKLAIAVLGLALMTASVAAAEGYRNYVAPGYPNTNPGHKPQGFSDARPRPYKPPAPPAAPTYRAAPSHSQFAPLAPIVGPAPQRFKPYGDYSKGGSPSAPKPPGYIDLYGTKRSEHPFLY